MTWRPTPTVAAFGLVVYLVETLDAGLWKRELAGHDRVRVCLEPPDSCQQAPYPGFLFWRYQDLRVSEGRRRRGR